MRKAFALAVDRERAGAALMPLARAATGGAIPPSIPGHTPGLCPEADLEKARALLREAGYPEGRGLPELELGVPTWVASVEPLLEAWQALGARVSVQPCTANHPMARDTHLTISAWKADFPDPDGFFRGLNQGGGWPFYRDDEIAALLDDARSVRDQAERIRLYQEIDRIWVTERTTILPLAYGRRIMLRRPWVHGVWASPLSRPHYEQVVVEREPADEAVAPVEVGGVPGH